MGKQEVLREVREAERRVREMLEEAERERDAKQAQARRDADRIEEEGYSDIDRRSEEAFQKAAAETQRLVDVRVHEGRETVERERKVSEKRLSEAVDRLVSELERSITQD